MTARLRAARAALHIARRDAWRAKARSLTVLVMIALPVLAVVALDTLFRTVDVTPAEGLPRQLGAADALVIVEGEGQPVVQDPTARATSFAPRAGDPAPVVGEPDAAAVLAVLPGSRLVPLAEKWVDLRTAGGRLRAQAVEVAGDPLTEGLYETAGRAPTAPGEVAVSERLARRGLTPGTTTRGEDDRELRVVGTVRHPAEVDSLLLLAAPGTLPELPQTQWLVDAPGPVTWAQVRQLNARGFVVLSRAVVLDPPPASEVPELVRQRPYVDTALLAVIGLAAAMALLEVVLLAGPAFAVGARRQRRALALLAATGGEPRHVRQVVLVGGLVLGGTAALVGVALGIGTALLARPLVQRFTPERLGPFDVSARDVALIALVGTASAVLAALAPAISAARQDVVPVLAGRRGTVRGSRTVPTAGLALLALGIAGSAAGARGGHGQFGGEFVIAFSAMGVVLGAVLLAPALLGLAGRLAGRLPLPARFAVRDAARQRGRTAPAVAAVAATVAGVVALGVGGSSDAAEARATYQPRAPMGTGVVTSGALRGETWSVLRDTVTTQLPDAQVRLVSGLPFGRPGPRDEQVAPWQEVRYEICRSGEVPEVEEGECGPLLTSYGSAIGSPVLVGVDAFDLVTAGLPAAEIDAARRTLARAGWPSSPTRPCPSLR